MDLVKVQYTGSRGYIDRTPLRNVWKTGDTKALTAVDARAVLKFVEFRKVDDKITEDQAAQAQIAKRATEQEQEDEEDTHNAMLDLVVSMDKGALKAYAEKYEVKLDARRKVSELREEVAGLVDQFGAR